MQKSGNNEQNSAPPSPFPGPAPPTSVAGVAAAGGPPPPTSLPPGGSTTVHSHGHLHPHDGRPSSAGGLPPNSNMMMSSGTLPPHTMFGPTPPPQGTPIIGGDKSALGPPHASHIPPAFSSANQVIFI